MSSPRDLKIDRRSFLVGGSALAASASFPRGSRGGRCRRSGIHSGRRAETAWYHPVHLHGRSFRVIARNGRPTSHREWLDTVLIPPREQADIAFVGDKGDWMFHCHILDHLDGGMMAVIRVA